MLLEFNEEEEGDQQEIPQATAPEGEEQTPRRASRVHWSPPYFLSERQAPEHSKSPSVLQNITWVLMIDALGYKSCLETLDAYNFLVQKYTFNPV